MHRGHRCAQDGISWFEVHSRQQRLHGSRIGGTRSSAATSRTELRPKPAWSGTRSRYDGGRSITSLNTSVLGGKPMGAPAYPTDRILGGAEPGRSRPRSMGSRWRHQELAHGRVGRGRGSFRTSHHGPSASVVAGGLPPPAYRPHGPRFRGARALGAGCIRVLASRCALVLGRPAGCRPSSSHRDVERVQSEPVATSVRFPGDPFVPAGVPAVSGARRWSNSVREVKGHERAAAVVHPIKVSPRTQDRVDRKRSRREYPTNTGARFAGRALCSPSQRDERRPGRR
jgi:hypothetical protein